MKVTYDWLKNFVDLKISPAELAQKLTMAGLEVVSLEQVQGDYVFEIEITSNRPDWLSVLGIAREVSAITGAKLKTYGAQSTKHKVSNKTDALKIKIENKKDCSFYSACIIRDVGVGSSPEWLKKRIESIGLRSVNNIVDITNYILFETGHPLHAFDLDKLASEEICIRRARAGEKIITIDAQEKLLGPEILVISDNNRPVALAGIMGGKDTEVTSATRNILLESAVFNPVLIRQARKKLGIMSESAYRFERGASFSAAQIASQAASELILKFASGKMSAYKSSGTAKISASEIKLDPAYVNRILGAKIPTVKIKQILSKLGLTIKAKGKNVLAVKIPDSRQDLETPIDLVEEVVRIYGFEKIPQTIPAIVPQEKISERKDIVSNIKNILCGLGLNEAITYSMIDRALLMKSAINIGSDAVRILNPLSSEQEILRPTLLASLIRTVSYNLDQQQEQVGIFEIADIFLAAANKPEEEPALAIALCGADSFLISQGLVKDNISLLHLKGILENLFNKLRINEIDFVRLDDDKIEIFAANSKIGEMFNLSQQALGNFDIKNKQVVLAQINLKQLFGQIKAEKKFSGISRYPAITRDISFVIKNDVPVKEMLKLIKEKGTPLLSLVKVVDYYQGKQIPDGQRGLTVSCVYRNNERTLTEEEINPVHDEICSLLKERFDIKLR